MTLLLSVQSISKSFGAKKLFQKINLTITSKDRIGLLGPNGAGKSTLLKILTGFEPMDEGAIAKKQGLKIGFASQSPEFPDLSLLEVMMEGHPQDETRAKILLGKAQFEDIEVKASSLSGGWKKRLDIVRAFMNEPDLIFLDEPTNHLDIEGILWLEKFLAKEQPAYVIVSHDRYFLEKAVNKTIELNRAFPQGLLAADGPLSRFFEIKEEFLKNQEELQRSLAGQVKTEIEWLRTSPKARTTKSEARIKRAENLIETLADVKKRNKIDKVSIEFSSSERSTKKLLAAKNLSKTLGGKLLFKGLDVLLSPGTRLGIVGKNGTGKTTLLKILAGQTAPDLGTIKIADNLKLVYFDQHREKIPPHLTIKEALSPNSDVVNYRGQEIHVNGWAKKFLFPTDRLNLRVSAISGGERARLLIAKLMLEPADILFLDEPTNDLDIQTLEVIEESLKEFSGAVVLISHDRCLMDTICTQVLAIQDSPAYFADYSQWESSLRATPLKKEILEKKAPPPKKELKKLSFNEKRELDGMEDLILSIEAEITELHKQLQTTDPAQSLQLYQTLSEKEKFLEEKFIRWQYLQDFQ